MRLDRLVGKLLGVGKKEVRKLLESGGVTVAGLVILEAAHQVGKFDRVECHGQVVQDRRRRVVILNKPAGVVSATSDEEHRTVIDLIEEEWAGELHLAGRLDRFTTGLVILTNDSRFSESLTDPANKVGKKYLVEVDGTITEEVVANFKIGIWFAKEKVMTQPAQIELQGERRCRLTIFEGKHHQVKRMFARHGLKVTALHREAMGGIELPNDLSPGQWREWVDPAAVSGL